MVRTLLIFTALASLVACRQLSAAEPAEVEIDWPEPSTGSPPVEAPAPSPNDTRPE